MYPRILKQAFWDFYDHLGRLLVINLLLVFTLLPAIWFVAYTLREIVAPLEGTASILVLFLAIVVVAPLLGTPWLAGLHHFAGEASAERDPPLRALIAGWRQCGGRMFRTVLVLVLIAGVLFLNIWFYAFSGLLPESMAIPGNVLAGLCGWLAFALGGVALHALPLAARTQQPALRCVKTGALLLLRFPGATFLVFFTIIMATALGAALRLVGVLIYGFVLPVMLANSLHDVCADILEAEEEDPTDDRPASWREIHEDEALQEKRRHSQARYNRGLRDILRPWEM